jgi:hypothetical protein
MCAQADQNLPWAGDAAVSEVRRDARRRRRKKQRRELK